MTTQPFCRSLRIPIPEPFRAHVDAAVTRLGYLYPTAQFTAADGAIDVQFFGEVDLVVLRRDAHHTLYREKIYADTLGMRTALIEAVTRR